MVHAYNQYQRHIIQAIRNTVSCTSYCLLTKMTDKDEGEFSLSFTKYTFTNNSSWEITSADHTCRKM
jgi:hypothetical protein